MVSIWQEALVRFSANQIDAAFRQHFVDSEFFPKPANIIDRIELAHVQPTFQPVGDECPQCGDFGWIYLSPEELEKRGTENAHVRRCYCGRGQGVHKPTAAQLREYGIARHSPEAKKFQELLAKVAGKMNLKDSVKSPVDTESRKKELKAQAEGK
jgi:hypothetical protein